MKLLKKTPHDNILILSIRAIALILEMIPRSCNRVVAAGATPMLIKYLATSGMRISYFFERSFAT